MKPLIAAALVMLSGCPAEEQACEPEAWALIGELEDVTALSVHGTTDDLWVVGGGVGAGQPLAARWDGTVWSRIAAGNGNTTWWWSWTSPRGDTWLVGDDGIVVRLDRDGTVIQQETLGVVPTLYGVWGSADDDVWIVGTDNFVTRWNGDSFQELPGPAPAGVDFFKVWGAGRDDVWISGEGGTMLHWTGAAFVDHSAELATLAPALTVHGCASTEVYAVAGQGFYAWDGTAWARRSEPALGSVANGVACGAGGVLIVGNAGLKWRWERGGAWLDERARAPTGTDLHGAFLDEAGRTWAVGGNFNAPPGLARTGVVGVRGCPRPSEM